VVDVAGLNLNTPENAMMLSVKEKAMVQVRDRAQPELPMRPGLVELSKTLITLSNMWMVRQHGHYAVCST